MDPVASLRAVPIEFDLGEWTYELPAMWAGEWIEVMAYGSPARIVPGLLHPQDQLQIMRDLLAHRISPDDILAVTRLCVEAAGGRKWWTVQRLVDSALQASTWPTLHGQMVLKGVNLESITLAGFTNMVHVLALQGCEKQADRDKLMWELEKPPPGFAKEAIELPTLDEFSMMLAEQERVSGGTPGSGQRMIGQ